MWGRKQPFWVSWLAQVGIKTKDDRHTMPLLQGETAAVPILMELLASRDPHARLMAAEGLEKVGEEARPAVPSLLRALNDEDATVREQVEQALFSIDRETAERAGLEGLMRRP
jgi:HEAT repeat protein